MGSFAVAYAGLNAAQKRAVDTIDGPVLVVAGPGTGKTQLLSARVAHMLQVTDVLPQNILCLTFTESGATAMRDRLTQFIGKSAYDVQIGTYHSFGADLIRRFPEYFGEARLERPADTLMKRQLLSAIVEDLGYQNPLKQTRHHLGDLISTISEVKRGRLKPKDLRDIAESNLRQIAAASSQISDMLDAHTKRLPSKLDIAQPLFTAIAETLQEAADATPSHPPFENLAALASEQLEAALDEAAELKKATPFTRWKNKWLAKDENNRYILAGTLEAKRMHAMADVLEQYEAALAKRGLYDFDDMILRAIAALEQHNDFRFSLHEQYQYLLLDEFQDTNAAQLRLVELLTNNPIHEGRPNVLAVGDDDQAIYAFQGAQYSNMLQYFRLYHDVTVINLSENYRSASEILETASGVAGQIADTLRSNLPALSKALVAANSNLPKTVLERIEYTSDVAERAGVAARIQQLIAGGVQPNDIAVLAPKHRYLEALVPYLDGTPLRYERRENVLEAPIVQQLICMSRLVLALRAGSHKLADSLWPEVLSYDCWNFSTSAIWQLSWQASDTRKPWAELLLTHEQFRPAALLFLSLAGQVETETLEVVLDQLLGTSDVETREQDMPRVRSPLRSWLLKAEDDQLYHTVNQLTVLRARLREHQLAQAQTLKLADLLTLVDEYTAAEEQMLNTSPYSDAAAAVQLMTVFKAKGLEFAHVFLLSCQDEVWGNSSRDNANKLTLPANLAPIRHAGSTEDERLRIFFVAITRAKYGLYLTSHRANYAGKKTLRLKYLAEVEQPDGSVTSDLLPNIHATVVTDGNEPPSIASLQQNWQTRHTGRNPALKELLASRLQSYSLSPTHLTSFIDLEHAGPEAFLLNTLLRFPVAPGPDIAFGNAMHESLEWLQRETNQTGTVPELKAVQHYFASQLSLQALTENQLRQQTKRGNIALTTLLARPELYFTAGNIPEYNFRGEGAMLDGVRLGGKIDLIEINKTHKTITVVDYKTGRLGSDPAKLHRYTLQLYCYKLLIEHSHSFRGYQVEQGRLLFVEPDSNGKLTEHHVQFTPAETTRVAALVAAMWRHVQVLDLPDASAYPSTLGGIKQFEQDLIDDKI